MHFTCFWNFWLLLEQSSPSAFCVISVDPTLLLVPAMSRGEFFDEKGSGLFGESN